MLLLMTPNRINLLINTDTVMGTVTDTDTEPHKKIQLNISNKDKS
jgi:hypothetical protein